MVRVQGAGCRVQGSGFRVQGAGCRVQGAGFRVQGAGCRVQGSGCRFQGSGCRGQGCTREPATDEEMDDASVEAIIDGRCGANIILVKSDCGECCFSVRRFAGVICSLRVLNLDVLFR